MDATQLVTIVCAVAGAICGSLATYFGLRDQMRKHYEAIRAADRAGLQAENQGLLAENRALHERIELLLLADNISWVDGIQARIEELRQHIKDLEDARGANHEKYETEISEAEAEIARLQAALDASEAERLHADQKLDDALAAVGVSDEAAADIKEAVSPAAFSRRLLQKLLSEGVGLWHGILHDAAEAGDAETVTLLLEHGAPVNAEGAWDDTALHVAVHEGHVEVATILLDYHADPNAKNVDGRVPLHFAALRGDGAVAGLLLRRNADVDAQDKYGTTPLHLAATKGYDGVVAILLEHGADTSLRNTDGRTALDLALQGGLLITADLLRRAPGEE